MPASSDNETEFPKYLEVAAWFRVCCWVQVLPLRVNTFAVPELRLIVSAHGAPTTAVLPSADNATAFAGPELLPYPGLVLTPPKTSPAAPSAEGRVCCSVQVLPLRVSTRTAPG